MRGEVYPVEMLPMNVSCMQMDLEYRGSENPEEWAHIQTSHFNPPFAHSKNIFKSS